MASTLNASTTLGLISSADTSGVLQLQTANTAALTIDGSQNVGVGMTPVYKLDVTGGNGNAIRFTDSVNSVQVAVGAYNSTGFIGTLSNHPELFYTNGAERMRLDTSGNLGLGVTPSTWTSVKAIESGELGSAFAGGGNNALVLYNTYFNSGFKYANSSRAASYYQQTSGQHIWYNAPSGTAGNAITFTQAMTLDASGRQIIGGTSAYGNSRITLIPASNPTTASDAANQISIGESSANSAYSLKVGYLNIGGGYAGSLQAIAGGSATNLLLNADGGNVLMGGTDPSALGIGSQKVNCIGSSGSSALLVTEVSGSNASAALILAASTSGYTANIVDIRTGMASGTGYNAISYKSDTNVTRFNVSGNGNVTNTNNSYGAISDVKLKENIVDASPKLADLMQVQVRNYNLIGETTKQLGVVAQELETVFPSMIDETPDKDAEGNDLGTTTKSVKYSVFVPMLIKALQEQQAIIESLKADVAALKG